MSSKKGFDTRAVGAVIVDSGHIEMGDCGQVQLALPTGIGDGLYPVSELSIDGDVIGYFVNVRIEDYSVSELNGPKKYTPRVEQFADPKLAATWSRAMSKRYKAEAKRASAATKAGVDDANLMVVDAIVPLSLAAAEAVS